MLVADLATYNTTVTYSNDRTIVEASDFADEFWSTFIPCTFPDVLRFCFFCFSAQMEYVYTRFGWLMFFLLDSAVVAVDIKQAEKFQLSKSEISPTNPEEMLYQIDGFHELHCLVSSTYDRPT